MDKPLIQYAVEEAYAAGIREMIFVTGRNKRAIEDHFDSAYELENELAASGKNDLIALINAIKPADMECVYIRQSKALGLGHAILCAEQLVHREPFAVLLADDLMIGDPPVMKQMTDLFEQHQCSILAVQEVPKEHARRYGIVQGHYLLNNLTKVTELFEKPELSRTSSTLAVSGRYILTPNIFDCIRNQKPGAGGEIQLTDGIANLMRTEQILAFSYKGVRYDCGTKLGLLQANVDLGTVHSELNDEFLTWLYVRSLELLPK